MMKFDGVYGGKLVKDWGDEEWSRFYHEVYAPNEIVAKGKNDERAMRLYLGPDFSDEEVIEALHYGSREWIECFDCPVTHYSEREGNSIGGMEKLGITHDENFERYTYPSVCQRFEEKLELAKKQ